VEAHRVVRRRGSHLFEINQVTDGDEVVSHTRPLCPGRFLVQNFYTGFSVQNYLFKSTIVILTYTLICVYTCVCVSVLIGATVIYYTSDMHAQPNRKLQTH
jgi:hypothetical protein